MIREIKLGKGLALSKEAVDRLYSVPYLYRGIQVAPAERYFPRFTEWPAIDPAQKYRLVWFEDETLEGFDEVNKRLIAEGIGPEKRTVLTHLIASVAPNVQKLSVLHAKGKAPGIVYPSSELSFWRKEFGRVSMPSVKMNYIFSGFGSDVVEQVFYSQYGLLVLE